MQPKQHVDEGGFTAHKILAKLKTCSVEALEHHPRLGRKFTVHDAPFEHAVMAQSIVAAYSAVEELGLEVRANAQRPSKVNGQWNPVVLGDLQTRLAAAGINFDKPLLWLVRNSPTRIERRHPPPSGNRLSWTRYEVRDREVQIVDAIHYAGLLRSRISAHRMHDLTRSLTLHDVSNVQLLARRLLLESMRFWDFIGTGEDAPISHVRHEKVIRCHPDHRARCRLPVDGRERNGRSGGI